MQKFVESRWFLALTALLYLALAGLLLYIIGARTKPEIEVMLTKLIPRALWANFLLIAIGIVLCRRDIAGAFRGLFAVRPRPLPVETGGTEAAGDHTPREAADPGGAAARTEKASRFGRLNRPGVWLLLVFIAGLILASQVAPQIHRIYYDEDIYANMAQNMAFTGQTGMANYGSVEYGEYFVNWLGYLRTRAARHLFLLAVVLPFACYMRPESSLIALWALAAVSFNLFSTGSDPEPPFRHPFATRSFWATGLIAFALIIPHIWHFFTMSGQSWGAPGAKFSTSFFANNLTVNGFYFLNNKAFPILFTLLALVGLAAWKIRPGRGGEKIGPGGVSLMLLWFLLFWGIFLFFYAGSYKYSADVRFALEPVAVAREQSYEYGLYHMTFKK